jgi:hypothetical protein
MTFFDVVLGGGAPALLIWILVFVMLLLSPFLVIAAIIVSLLQKGRGHNAMFKSLIFSVPFTLAIGSFGVLLNMFKIHGFLEPSGAARGQSLAACISYSLYIPFFAILASVPYLFAIFICTIILHFKSNPLSKNEESGQ